MLKFYGYENPEGCLKYRFFMTMYQPGIPTGTVDLDQDYLNIQRNFTQLDTTFGVDHVTYSNATPQNGYHKSLHMNPVSTTVTNAPNNQPVVPPTATSGFGQLFSSQINDGINLDESLYFLSGGNRLTQLTRNFQPVAGSNGYTSLPGGFILQWGEVGPTAATSLVVPYNISFPNNNFVTLVTAYKAASVETVSYYVEIPTFLNQFTIINTSGHTFGYAWMAIGI